jgi:BirA family biotin operon repressor/biotin-[acetyl-CoA-carboxylase] ligase
MIGKPFIILSSVDSTNNHAMGLIREGKAASGMAIFALEQTNGKGQRGKTWQSNIGENIMLTTVLDSKGFSIHEQFPISAAVALGCYDFFSKYAGEETSIKWPNDIFWRDRKAGGILIENIIHHGDWEWCVIGMGININQVNFSDIENKTVSIKQITGQHFDPIKLSKDLLACIYKRIATLKSDGAVATINEYNMYLYKKGQLNKFKRGQKVFEAEVHQVNIHGELQISHAITENIRHGELVWLL